MRARFEFAQPERVSVGTIGPVGQRAFFLQARQGAELLTLKLEKQQVAALSQRLGELLQRLPRAGELPADAAGTLEAFGEADFVVGALALAYDARDDRIVVLAEELVGEDEEGAEARLALTREQAGALAIEGVRLVEAGRPPCPLCGFPLDPRGHACPRTNGHRPPLT
ncbi:MAG TPA: DUF3090 family protein [Acidimicrobiales bacterium]|jgi:uncharacterized repeat protein (TIGR03847 family)|nr:DUF3090 family protein [Acidimicrobiales bacterium]